MNRSAPLIPLISARRQFTLGAIGAWNLSFAFVAFCISDTMLTLGNGNSLSVKIFAFFLLSSAILLRPRFHRLILLTGPLLFVLWMGLARSFNAAAGQDEFLRFLFPIVITVGLFAYRDRLDTVIKVFIAVVVSNDLFQCYFYVAYLTGLPLLLPVRIDSGLFLRAQGWLGFFSEFSFINFCAFMLYRRYRPTSLSKAVSWIFMLFALLGFSFRLVAAVMFYPLMVIRRDPRSWAVVVAGLGAAVLLITSGCLDSLLGVAAAKISFYIVDGDSARAEAYRVMFESLGKGNLLGAGLGSFGGPAAVKYGSPLYSEYHFNWYGLGNVLTTSDAFYPHLFVELGFIGGIVWLCFVLFYGQGNRRNAPWIFIVAAFCLDNVFSLAFLSPSYVFSGLLVMYTFSGERQENFNPESIRRPRKTSE